jgi:hypothetical protein
LTIVTNYARHITLSVKSHRPSTANKRFFMNAISVIVKAGDFLFLTAPPVLPTNVSPGSTTELTHQQINQETMNAVTELTGDARMQMWVGLHLEVTEIV